MKGEKTEGLKQMWIKRSYFELIKSGKKTLEGRIAYPGMRRIKKGDVVLLRTGGEEMKIKIVDVREYRDFQEALKHEDLSRLLPGIGPENALEVYQRIYPEWKIKQYGGVLIFELVVLEK